MLNRRDIIYLYDGSIYGLLCAVFECYVNKEYPLDIECEISAQQTIGCSFYRVKSDYEHFIRVKNSIKTKISPTALSVIYRALLSEETGIELEIFEFIQLGYKLGGAVVNMLNIDSVRRVVFAAKAVASEAHQFKEFIRFSELDKEIYYSEIEPKYNVLPVISSHFTERFSSMPFLIYDKNRKKCLVYNGRNTEIRDVHNEPFINISKNESEYRKMWKMFFETIEIKERHNEKCQNTHLPKRYRRNMTEFQ